eukprot:scaffold897_cov402-Prasinococcus_capsulatus_cf.AAC.62
MAPCKACRNRVTRCRGSADPGRPVADDEDDVAGAPSDRRRAGHAREGAPCAVVRGVARATPSPALGPRRSAAWRGAPAGESRGRAASSRPAAGHGPHKSRESLVRAKTQTAPSAPPAGGPGARVVTRADLSRAPTPGWTPTRPPQVGRYGCLPLVEAPTSPASVRGGRAPGVRRGDEPGRDERGASDATQKGPSRHRMGLRSAGCLRDEALAREGPHALRLRGARSGRHALAPPRIAKRARAMPWHGMARPARPHARAHDGSARADGVQQPERERLAGWLTGGSACCAAGGRQAELRRSHEGGGRHAIGWASVGFCRPRPRSYVVVAPLYVPEGHNYAGNLELSVRDPLRPKLGRALRSPRAVWGHVARLLRPLANTAP